MAKKNYYAVAKGKQIGIFDTWDEAKSNVSSFPGAIYKGFASMSDAIDFLKEHNVYEEDINKKKKENSKKSDTKKVAVKKKNAKTKEKKDSNNKTDSKVKVKKKDKNENEELLKEEVQKSDVINVSKKKENKKNIKSVDIRDIFSDDGVFSKNNPYYKKREFQIEATCLLEEALRKKGHFLLSASTGFGKSLTFSTAAMKNMLENGDGKIVIVTSNISLQEQLFYKDIPFVINAFIDLYGKKSKDLFKPTLFKGINNFICLNKYEESFVKNKLTNKIVIKQLKEFMDKNESGDLGEADFSLSNDVKRLITTTSDECKGKNCPNKEECYNNKHKDIARGSNIIVTNYHMLFASYLAGSSVFFGTDTIIFDEAHEIEKILREFEATSISSSGVSYIERKLSEIKNLDGGGKISEKIDEYDLTRLRENSDDFFEQLENKYMESKKGPCIVIESQRDLPNPDNFKISLLKLAKFLEKIESYDIGPGTSDDGDQKSVVIQDDQEEVESKKRDLKKRIKSLKKSCYKTCSMISGVDEILEDENKVLWVEKENNLIRIGLKDVDVSSSFRNYFLEDDELSCILTSATITVNESFEYIKERLGIDSIENPNKQVYEFLGNSPFNLEMQQLWYVPKNAVAGNKSNFEDDMVEQIAEIIEGTGGGVLCLFTSMSNLNKCKRELPKYIKGKTILAQGDASRRKILEDFKNNTNSSLLATKSFFTGVDVPGESLRCVIIDKLPFESPNDPVQQKLKERKYAFSKYMLPEMIITLQQAVGRGIRSIDDFCIIALLDERIISSNYSSAILGSFNYKKFLTRDINDVEHFIKLKKYGSRRSIL